MSQDLEQKNNAVTAPLQIIAFLVACGVLIFTIISLSDTLTFCNMLVRVLISTFVATFLYVIPNIENLSLNIPKGISAVGAIAVFFALVFIPINCEEDNFYAFNLDIVDYKTGKVINNPMVVFSGDAIGRTKYLKDYTNQKSITGNYNIGQNKEIRIRISHPDYINHDTTLLISNLQNDITIRVGIKPLGGNLSLNKIQLDYSQYKFDYTNFDTTGGVGNLDELYTYYNKEIFDSFKSHLNKNDISGVTLLAAPGGYGKSFLISDNVVTNVDSSIKAIEFEFPSILKRGTFKMKTDLQVELIDSPDPVSLGVLPHFKSFSIQDYFRDTILFDQRSKKVILLDGLDEIHPESANLIIQNIEKEYKRYPNTWFLLLARPETFNTYFSDPSFRQDNNINFVQLKEIKYLTMGDLKLRINNICGYLKGVCDEIIFEDLVQACSVILHNNPDLNQAFGNLRVSKDFISFIASMMKSKRTPSEDEIKSFIIDQIFNAEKDKHNRPSTLDRTALGYQMYFKLFNEVAKKYSGQIAPDGSFLVLDNDIISFEFNKKNHSFFVRNLLDRSGFINMEPADTPAKLYKFSPSFAFNYFLKN